MPNPTAAMLVIGDEILSGRTRDANLYHLSVRLAEAGIDLIEARIVADVEDAIVEAVQALSSRADHVFTSGGIGPTHDDITADAVARAMGVGIGVDPDARARLKAHYDAMGEDLTDARLRMARVPEGATLIDNPVSAAPGFSIGNVHVMAGIPRIFQAMLDGVLARLSHGQRLTQESVEVNKGESLVADALRRLAAANADVSIGSYPFEKDGRFGATVVVRGTDPARVADVARQVAAEVGDP